MSICSVHIPIFCANEAAKHGALLTLKTVRVGFPTKPVVVHWFGNNESVFGQVKAICGYDFPLIVENLLTNDRLIKYLVENEKKPFAVVDSDVVFYENCEDFEPSALIAGEYIPEFVCPIANAVTRSRLHTAFFVVSDPVKLRRKIELAYRPAIPKFCPFNPFAPVTVFNDETPVFYDSCAVLYQAIGGEKFGPDMLKRFEHCFSGSYATGAWAARIKAAYENPESARGTRQLMQRYLEERKP